MLTRLILILLTVAVGSSGWADDRDSRKKTKLRELLQKATRLNPDARLPELRTWEIADKTREALIFKPLKETRAAPVVFGFHGHGGNARNAARSFRMHELWPEALVVYMQGIPTPGPLTDPEGKRNGWQHNAGEQEDRDFKFFDAVLARVRQDYKIDDNPSEAPPLIVKFFKEHAEKPTR